MLAPIVDIPFQLDFNSLAKTVHLSGGTDDAREFKKLLNKARRISRPKALYRECFVGHKGLDTVTIDHVTFVSPALRLKLDKVERVFAYAATCGNEIDGLDISRDDFLKKFWLDNIKTVLLGFSIAHLRKHLDLKYKLGKTASMNPGSGDAAVWPLAQQKELFALIGDVAGLIGVRLTDSCLMIPNKSVSGIYFPTEINFYSCQVCHREKCVSRKAPFDPALWKSIDHSPPFDIKRK